jgi:hypothetical protein
MSFSSINQSIDLSSKSVSNIYQNIEKINDNIQYITKEINQYSISENISELNNKLENFSSWLKQFKEENKQKDDKDYKIYNNHIKSISKIFESLLTNNNKIQKKLQKSLAILQKINIIFDPSESSINSTDDKNNISLSGNKLFEIISQESDKDILINSVQSKDHNDTESIEQPKININVIRLAKDYKEEFIKNFSKVLNVLVLKSNILANSSNISEFPVIDDYTDVQEILEFFKKVCDLSDNSISIGYNSKYSELLNNSITEALKNFLVNKENKEDNAENLNEIENNFNLNSESGDDEAYYKNDFKEIKKKLFYFINIISKENANYDKDGLESISDSLIECLKIEKNNLFLLQNSQIDNFVKINNFNEIPMKQMEIFPKFSEFKKLYLLKMKLLIENYAINKDCFDNRGNFLNPNARKNIYRGKEIYEPPYGWMGLGLNVLGKYQDDIWLEDITDKSEWAIAYRGIFSIDENKMKGLIKYYIEKQDLKIAETTIKGQIYNRRRWKSINKGVYITPYIKVAEKYTQSISFNNKKYKVLLMAKVKIGQIVEPEGSDFWILNNDYIRIYRVLFKEI